jgi:hypothetical protein
MRTAEIAGSYRPPFTDISGVYEKYVTTITTDYMNQSLYEGFARDILSGCAKAHGIRCGLTEPLHTKENDRMANAIIDLWKKAHRDGRGSPAEYMPFLKALVEGV